MGADEQEHHAQAAAAPGRGCHRVKFAAKVVSRAALPHLVGNNVRGCEAFWQTVSALTVRGTQALVSFAPLAFKLFCAARQNAVLRHCPVPLIICSR